MKRAPITPERIVEAVRLRGSNAEDVRDAIHEACHAVDVGLRPPWTRERIHTRILARAGAVWRAGRIVRHGDALTLLRLERNARLLEHAACARFGVEYDTLQWITVAALEAARLFSITATAADVDRMVREQDQQVQHAQTQASLDRLIARCLRASRSRRPT